MNHLSEEQFEDILQGQTIDTEHINHCPQCQKRLAEKRALANRLQSAFAHVEPPDTLAQQIRAQIGPKPDVKELRPALRIFTLHWQRWAAAVSTIAAVLIIAPFLFYSLRPLPAHAALVEIHEHNLSEGHNFVAESDPRALAAYFKEQLGFNPKLPQPTQGLNIRGCCVHHFKGDIVGSYVVETPKGIISVIVVSDKPETLGPSVSIQEGKYTYFMSHFAKCNMVSVRIDEYTYCAVGEVPYEYLKSLLMQLLPEVVS